VKGKPAPEGHKILALCQAGYTYAFLDTSRIKSIIGMEKIPRLSFTSSAVVHLAKVLSLFNTRIQYIHGQLHFRRSPFQILAVDSTLVPVVLFTSARSVFLNL